MLTDIRSKGLAEADQKQTTSEYLRLFSKKEQLDRRFASLWSYQAPASSTGRIIIPLWGCEAQWFDSALNLTGDLRQQDFYYD